MKDESQHGGAEQFKPSEWMRYARSDWAHAQIEPPELVLTEMLCFHIQQAEEKALKALFCHFDLEIKKTHDIEWLMTKLEAHVDIPPEIWQATRLSVYSVLSRYPAGFAEIESPEYEQAIVWGKDLMDWVTSIIE